jgi:hypothetical protein
MVTGQLVASPIPKVVLSKINYSKQFFGENWMSLYLICCPAGSQKTLCSSRLRHDLGWKVNHMNMKWKGRYLLKQIEGSLVLTHVLFL